MEQYNLCGLSSLSGCGLRSIADQQHPAPLEIEGSALMHKVVFAAALAVGLITAPMSQFVSSAAAQQANAEKNAKMKKEPSTGQLATRKRQKKCGAEWKEAKASNKIEKGTRWPKFWSACNKRLKSAAN
jgi:hypothetical protein